MARLLDLTKSSLRNILQRILGTPKDHKEEIMRIVMHAVKTWDLPPGDYLEFGVFKGRSFIYAYKFAVQYKMNMHFYAFDSFKGLPEPTGIDRTYDIFRKGDYACDEQSFRDNLMENSVDKDMVTIVPGFFDNTLNEETRKKLNIKRASIVWIDCDIYESTKPVLNFITDFLTTGSIIIFDDWFCFSADPNAGEIRATSEWLEQNPHVQLVEYKQFGIFGQSFIVQVEN